MPFQPVKLRFRNEYKRIGLQQQHPGSTASNINDLEELQRVASRIFRLKNKGCALTFVDDEGDVLTLDDEEELREAIRLSRGEVLRLGVKTPTTSPASPSSSLSSQDANLLKYVRMLKMGVPVEAIAAKIQQEVGIKPVHAVQHFPPLAPPPPPPASLPRLPALVPSEPKPARARPCSLFADDEEDWEWGSRSSSWDNENNNSNSSNDDDDDQGIFIATARTTTTATATTNRSTTPKRAQALLDAAANNKYNKSGGLFGDDSDDDDEDNLFSFKKPVTMTNNNNNSRVVAFRRNPPPPPPPRAVVHAKYTERESPVSEVARSGAVDIAARRSDLLAAIRAGSLLRAHVKLQEQRSEDRQWSLLLAQAQEQREEALHVVVDIAERRQQLQDAMRSDLQRQRRQERLTGMGLSSDFCSRIMAQFGRSTTDAEFEVGLNQALDELHIM